MIIIFLETLILICIWFIIIRLGHKFFDRKIVDKIIDSIIKDLFSDTYDKIINITKEDLDYDADFIKDTAIGKENFKRVNKNILFSNLLKNKNINTKDLFEYIDGIIEDYGQISIKILYEHFFIYSGIYLLYLYPLDKMNNKADDYTRVLYYNYMNNINCTDFCEGKVLNTLVDHKNGVYKVINDRIELIEKIKKIENPISRIYHNESITKFKENADNLIKIIDYIFDKYNGIDIYKEEISSMVRNECGKSFDDILNEKECFPIYFVNDYKLIDTDIFCKVLMYLDDDKRKIQYKVFIKEETYHTIRDTDTTKYFGLLSLEYFMFILSGIPNILQFRYHNDNGKVEESNE